MVLPKSRTRRVASILGMVLLVATLAISFSVLSTRNAQASGASFISKFHTISTIASAVPANGDINPYGIAVVRKSVGNLVTGNVLISNFNASSNLQGTGTTIVQISPKGKVSLFAQIDAASLPGKCPGGVGLTTALVALERGWVIVGSLPTTDGTSATAQAGCLIVLNSYGKVVETFTGPLINGPWDMAAFDGGNWAALFVSNVLNGTVAASPKVVNKGTVLRITLDVPEQGYGVPHRDATTIIGSGFSERTDPAALVIGPTGLSLGHNGTLFVADSVNNRIAGIPNALTRGTTAFAGRDITANGSLNDPLGLTTAPNGNILAVNGNDGNLVETTPSGSQIATQLLDNTGGTGGGCLFGLTVTPDAKGIYFVDDCDNTLKLLH